MRSVSLYNDDELVRRLDRLAAAERESLPDALACLAELERRSLHLERGYACLLDYCVERLKWGEGSAMQRIVAARTAALHPEIYSFLRDGQLNLSAVTRLAPFLTAENRTAILSRAAGRKRAALDEMLAQMRAEAANATAGVPREVLEESPKLDLPLMAMSEERRAAPGVVAVSAPASPSGSSSFESKPSECLRFLADEDLRRGLERTRRLLKRRCPSGALGDIVAHLVRDFLRRRDPESWPPACERPRRERQTRRVPQWVKDRVWSRDGGRCVYVAPDGRFCGSRWGLEYDHVRPWARGGLSDDPDNIRLLCRAHNLFTARREFGDRVPPARVSG